MLNQIKSLIRKLAVKGELRLLRSSIVGQYSNIQLADVAPNSPWFGKVVVRSLQIIEKHDPRRFSRVTREIDWIVNTRLFAGVKARYRAINRSCEIDFDEPSDGYLEGESEFENYAALYASDIVHEATHGRIRRFVKHRKSFGEMMKEERLCRIEQKRFLVEIEPFFPTAAHAYTRDLEADESKFRERYFRLRQHGSLYNEFQRLKRVFFEN